jgi:hypothetical protein
MTDFGNYFVRKMLEQNGWPKRSGLLSSKAVIDALVTDTILNQMVDWSAGLGACKPDLALKMIATSYKDRDWEDKNSIDVLTLTQDLKKQWESKDKNIAPHDVSEPAILSKFYGKRVDAKILNDPEVRKMIGCECIFGLLWGLIYPDRFKEWFEADEKRRNDQRPIYEEAGLEFDPAFLTLDKFLSESVLMLEMHEKENGLLSDIPQKLIEDVRKSGRDVSI